VSAFRVKLGANDLNCLDVPLNPTQYSLTHSFCHMMHEPVMKSEQLITVTKCTLLSVLGVIYLMDAVLCGNNLQAEALRSQRKVVIAKVALRRLK